MKTKSIFFIICLWPFIPTYSQKTMDCDCKNERTMIVTNITFKETKSSIEIESHCVSILRLYIVNNQGKENEKYELDCISKKNIKHSLGKKVNYLFHKPNGKFLSNLKGKDKFFKIINGKDNYYFEFTFNLKNEIIQIFDWTANLANQ